MAQHQYTVDMGPYTGKPLVTKLSADLLQVELADRKVSSCWINTSRLCVRDLYIAISWQLTRPPNNGEIFHLHAGVFNHRRDVGAVISGHTSYGAASSAAGETMGMHWQGKRQKQS
jgi:hypothetical protein